MSFSTSSSWRAVRKNVGDYGEATLTMNVVTKLARL